MSSDGQGQDADRPRVELFVRTLAPDTARSQQDRVIERLQRLDDQSRLRSADVYVCGECVCPSTAAAATGPKRYRIRSPTGCMEIREVLPRDAIQSIDDPAFGGSYFGEPDDEVVAVEADPPRAYPVRVLSHHEIVNDSVEYPADADGTVGKRPIAVTWCPICWSGAVYDRTVDGRILTFGVSGKLADDALVLYDHETGSEWKQPTGEAIAGEFAGRRLDVLPAPVVTWERFRTDHPDGVVLQPPRGGDGRSPRDEYGMAPYEAYTAREAFGLYGMAGQGERRSWDREDVGAKTVVLGIEAGDEAVGYPVPEVEAAGGVVSESVGETEVVVFTIDGGIHAFENPGYGFERRDGTVVADGTVWDPVTGESADGRALARVSAVRLFAFAWQDAHGPDAFFFAE